MSIKPKLSVPTIQGHRNIQGRWDWSPPSFFNDDLTLSLVIGQIEPDILPCPHQVCWHSLAPDICIWLWCARGWARKKVIKLGKQTARVSWTQTPRTVGVIHKWRHNFIGFFLDQILKVGLCSRMISTLRITLHLVFRCHIWMSPNAMLCPIHVVVKIWYQIW